jgi:hypothetical protein
MGYFAKDLGTIIGKLQDHGVVLEHDRQIV